MKKLNYCFRQEANSNVHKLYIYDDVREHGDFNWKTWDYDESETSAKYFRDTLEKISENDTIEIHINSNGGSVKEGVAIYNLLRQSKAHKTGYVDGVAYSIAFVILQACDERVMGVGTSALVHDMWITVSGNARELRKMADDLDVLMQSNRRIFMERSNLTEEELTDMMANETFLTPDECLEYGLIDKVDTYEATLKGTTGKLEEQVEQMKILLTQQKSFKEQLSIMHQEVSKKPPTPPMPALNLSERLARMFSE